MKEKKSGRKQASYKLMKVEGEIEERDGVKELTKGKSEK
jgi:hypothetical protein